MMTTLVEELLAGFINIVDTVGQMAKIAPAAIVLFVPVIGELNKRCVMLISARFIATSR